MTILALDTSTEACSVAVIHNHQTDFLFEVAPQKHSHILLPMIQTLLNTHNIKLAHCSAIAFGQGPGSFTGLRIAAAVAQGLSLAHRLPLIGISSLASLALAAKNQEPTAHYFLTALDARMDEIYYALYTFHNQQMTAVIADGLANPEEAATLLNPYLQKQPWVGIGSGIPLLQKYFLSEAILSMPDAYPCAREIALLAEPAYQRGAFTTIQDALPHYLRNDIVHQQ